MYNNYFTFSCSPFESTLDQRFLFMSECHEEVIAALLYFARAKKSFALVCGDVGTGKTMIVHHFLGKLPATVLPILVPYPDVEYVEILRYIARDLGIGAKDKDLLELSDEVKAQLARASAEGKQVVLIIDEAHLLPVASLENIRLLSNIELSKKKLLQIVLIGQNELATKLRKPELRQLRQRININRILCPMNPAETISYINHRLKIAGSSFYACFEPGCGKLIYELTAGVPRSINRLCDTALLICMTHKSEKVTRKILKKARAALESDSAMSAGAHHSGLLSHSRKLWPAFAAAAVLLIAVFFFGYGRYFGRHLKASIHGTVAGQESGDSRRMSRIPAFKAKVSADAVPAAAPANAPPLNAIEKSAGAGNAISPPGRQNGAGPPVCRQTIREDRFFGTKPQTAKPFRKVAVFPKYARPSCPTKGALKAQRPDSLRSDFTVLTVKKGDTLSGLAERWFPQNPVYGLEWILAANPQIHDKNLILIDQLLKIPKKN